MIVYDRDNNELRRDSYYPAARSNVVRSISWIIPSGYGEYTMEAFMIYALRKKSVTDLINFFAENDIPSLSLVSPTSGTWYRSGATRPGKYPHNNRSRPPWMKLCRSSRCRLSAHSCSRSSIFGR